MDRISSADRVIMLLRQRLLERSRTGNASRPDGRSSGNPAPGSLDGIQALAGVEGIDDHQLSRALIQSLLAEEFGAELINDAKFQQVVTRVVETIEGETGSAKLLSRLLGDLRASARG